MSGVLPENLCQRYICTMNEGASPRYICSGKAYSKALENIINMAEPTSTVMFNICQQAWLPVLISPQEKATIPRRDAINAGIKKCDPNNVSSQSLFYVLSGNVLSPDTADVVLRSTIASCFVPENRNKALKMLDNADIVIVSGNQPCARPEDMKWWERNNNESFLSQYWRIKVPLFTQTHTEILRNNMEDGLYPNLYVVYLSISYLQSLGIPLENIKVKINLPSMIFRKLEEFNIANDIVGSLWQDINELSWLRGMQEYDGCKTSVLETISTLAISEEAQNYLLSLVNWTLCMDSFDDPILKDIECEINNFFGQLIVLYDSTSIRRSWLSYSGPAFQIDLINKDWSPSNEIAWWWEYSKPLNDALWEWSIIWWVSWIAFWDLRLRTYLDTNWYSPSSIPILSFQGFVAAVS